LNANAITTDVSRNRHFPDIFLNVVRNRSTNLAKPLS
jgi:hypothetical protein